MKIVRPKTATKQQETTPQVKTSAVVKPPCTIDSVHHHVNVSSNEYILTVHLSCPLKDDQRPQLVLQTENSDDSPLSWSSTARVVHLKQDTESMTVQVEGRVSYTLSPPFRKWTWWIECNELFYAVIVPHCDPYNTDTTFANPISPPMHILSKKHATAVHDLRSVDTCQAALQSKQHVVLSVTAGNVNVAKIQVQPVILPSTSFDHVDVIPDGTETLLKVHSLINLLGQELQISQQLAVGFENPDASIVSQLYTCQSRSDALAAALLHSM